jgi:hypothetical protein
LVDGLRHQWCKTLPHGQRATKPSPCSKMDKAFSCKLTRYYMNNHPVFKFCRARCLYKCERLRHIHFHLLYPDSTIYYRTLLSQAVRNRTSYITLLSHFTPRQSPQITRFRGLFEPRPRDARCTADVPLAQCSLGHVAFIVVFNHGPYIHSDAISLRYSIPVTCHTLTNR